MSLPFSQTSHLFSQIMSSLLFSGPFYSQMPRSAPLFSNLFIFISRFPPVLLILRLLSPCSPRRRYCVLDGTTLTYFAAQEQGLPTKRKVRCHARSA